MNKIIINGNLTKDMDIKVNKNDVKGNIYIKNDRYILLPKDKEINLVNIGLKANIKLKSKIKV